jgi:transcriptional regulator with XRE-family HTH domain
LPTGIQSDTIEDMNAATLIRSARTDAGLTLRGLATVAKTSHSTLAAYEAGTKTPSVATLHRVVRAAGFEIDTTLRRRYRRDGALARGDELAQVLELAAQFPARHTSQLEAPIFGKAVDRDAGRTA